MANVRWLLFSLSLLQSSPVNQKALTPARTGLGRALSKALVYYHLPSRREGWAAKTNALANRFSLGHGRKSETGGEHAYTSLDS